jgi:hypothetical protein
MTNPLPDQWTTRDLPVLRRAAQILEVDGGDEVRSEGIAADLDLSEDAALRSLLALQDAGYVIGVNADSYGGRYVMVTDLTERGRRAVGIWPSEDIVDALITALERAADEATTSRTRAGYASSPRVWARSARRYPRPSSPRTSPASYPNSSEAGPRPHYPRGLGPATLRSGSPPRRQWGRAARSVPRARVTQCPGHPAPRCLA